MKRVFVFMLGICICAAGLVLPAAAEEEMSNYELTQRLQELEKKSDISKIADHWFQCVSISGLLEIEADYQRMDYDDSLAETERSSDLVFATAALGIDATINDYVSGHVVFLWEEDETEPVDLDEGFVTLRPGQTSPFYLAAGKMYVPFGNFSTNMVSDPLTLELGESRETAIIFGAARSGFYGSFYGFNGDVDEAGESSQVDNFGANAGYGFECQRFCLDLGVGYINNIYDSDGLEDFLEENEVDGIESYAGGVSSYAVFSSGPFMLAGEYITALDDVEYAGEAGKQRLAKKISAWNLELGYSFKFAGRNTTLGLAWQGTDNAGGFLPEDRYMCVAGMEIYDSTLLSLEYRHDEYENEDKNDVVTAQLAVAF